MDKEIKNANLVKIFHSIREFELPHQYEGQKNHKCMFCEKPHQKNT